MQNHFFIPNTFFRVHFPWHSYFIIIIIIVDQWTTNWVPIRHDDDANENIIMETKQTNGKKCDVRIVRTSKTINEIEWKK